MPPVNPRRPELAALRAKLAGGGGPAFWKSLDAVADTPAFRRYLRTEFPAAASFGEGPDRRRFLKLMAASFALSGLAGCDDQDGRDSEVPYVHNPEHLQPGTPLYYASATLLDGFANGAVVTTRNGRPIKIEGNDRHPWSRGGTDVLGQASVLGLYDPFRSQSVRYRDRISDWQSYVGATTGRLGELRAVQGRGLRVLTGPITSPSMQAQVAGLQASLPQSHWHTHAPADRSALYAGTTQAFGRPLETRWRFDKALVVVSLDGDFLDPGPHQAGISRDWVEARRAAAGRGKLLTLHAAAATPNLTSAKADYHLAAGPRALSELPERLRAAMAAPPSAQDADPVAAWCARAAAALRDAHGQGIVLAGATQPASVQEAVQRLNAELGNLGQSVFHTAPALAAAEDLAALVQAMNRGEVQMLLMLDTNPAYSAPGDLDFAGALRRVPLKIHAGLEADETAAYSDWHLPLTHPLESWGDARAFDGTVTLIQPTVAPLYAGRSLPEILSLLADAQPQAGGDLLRAHWLGNQDVRTFAPVWRQTLLDGFMPDTAFAAEMVRPVAAAAPPPAAAPSSGIDVLFRPDPTVWDGAPANNAWLQELPKPLTKIVWENVIAVAPALAERLHLANGDVVALSVGPRRVEGPAWVLPGQADNAATVFLGYGRSAADTLAAGLGYDAYPLRGHASPWRLAGASLVKTGRTTSLATTQNHDTMEGHAFVQTRAVGSTPPPSPEPRTLYPPWQDDGRAWGMVIDLDACIGCNACVVACQAENNIAVVGKEQVAQGRELHWLRVDRYYAGGLDDPATHFQPVPCMHCEQAPCEVGCPVEATLHDREGLNLQVYNRCIGTRACSSYCPYKVRHFNYYDYAADAAPSVQVQYNPTVSVRARGVMEKCTYCVQRIVAARITADRDNAPIADGAVQTACAGACPTRAIVFGDLNDSASKVRAARHDGRNYALLGELNTRPRTTYLAEWAPADPTPPKAG